MANVYVEPEPKGRPEGTPITHYVLEYAHGVRVTYTNYPHNTRPFLTQKSMA